MTSAKAADEAWARVEYGTRGPIRAAVEASIAAALEKRTWCECGLPAPEAWTHCPHCGGRYSAEHDRIPDPIRRPEKPSPAPKLEVCEMCHGHKFVCDAFGMPNGPCSNHPDQKHPNRRPCPRCSAPKATAPVESKCETCGCRMTAHAIDCGAFGIGGAAASPPPVEAAPERVTLVPYKDAEHDWGWVQEYGQARSLGELRRMPLRTEFVRADVAQSQLTEQGVKAMDLMTSQQAGLIQTITALESKLAAETELRRAIESNRGLDVESWVVERGRAR
jgi:hypothetical protein